MAYLSAFISILGSFVGLVYISYSWQGKKPASRDIKDDPRITGLLWCIFGLIIIFVADWQRLLKTVSNGAAPQVDILEFLACYFGGFVSGAVASLFVLVLKVSNEAKRVETVYTNIFSSQAFSPVIEFVLRGYDSYQSKLASAIQKHVDQENQKSASLEKDALLLQNQKQSLEVNFLRIQLQWRKRLSAEVAHIYIFAFDAHRGFISKRMSADRAYKDILQRIANIASYYTKLDSANVNCNYMIAQARQDISLSDSESARFTFDDRSRYDTYLLLAGYAKTGTNVIRLPVEPHDVEERWRHRTLPGAPCAFVHRKPVLCFKHSIEFARDVPKEVRAAQESYLETQRFDAIVSFPIMRISDISANAPPIGILNIDLTFDHNSIELGKIVEDVNEFESLLSPCIALLGDIMTVERLQSGKGKSNGPS